MRSGEKEIGRIGLGTAPLAFSGRPMDDGVEVTLAALESGVRLIDTALAYTRPGIESFAEAVVASALEGKGGRTPRAELAGARHFPLTGAAVLPITG